MRNINITAFVGSMPKETTNSKGKSLYTFKVASHEYSAKEEKNRDTYWFTLQCDARFKNILKCLKVGDYVEASGRYEDDIWQHKKDGKWEIHRSILVDNISFDVKSDRKYKKKKAKEIPHPTDDKDECPF